MASGISHDQDQIIVLDFLFCKKISALRSNITCDSSLLLKKRHCLGFPGGSEVKASASNAGDLGLIPGLGRSPGEGNGNPL